MYSPESAEEMLQLKLSLHRKLLSFMRTARPPREVVQCIVDTVWEHFEGHRISYFLVTPDGGARVLYSRGPASGRSLNGLRVNLLCAPNYLGKLLKREIVVVNDARSDEAYAPLLGEGAWAADAEARVDCPIMEEGGRVGVLSLTFPRSREWSDLELEAIREVAELIHLMLRDARSREHLKKNEMIFQQFADNIQAVFWMTDPDNNEMIYVSPAYETIWGDTLEYLYAHPRSFLDAIVPEDRARVIESLAHHKVGPYEKIYRIRRPDGSIRWIKDRSYPIRDAGGEVYRVVGIAEDLTPMRDAQAQISSNAKLASLGEMASGIAHEINNPLAVIQGLSVQLQELCERDRPAPVFQESLATIEKMSRRISLIVKGLRNISRQSEWDPMVSSDIYGTVQDTLALCEPRMLSAGIQLEKQFAEEKIQVCCRSAEISQVLVNLLNNAMDALEHAKRKVITLAVEKKKNWVRICVEDSGPGVPAAVADRIFMPFFTTKDVGKGTGLGLSISKGIVEAHGGRIFLDAASPRTRFVIELPAETE